MIYKKFIFPITQRFFWKSVRRKKKEWRQKFSINESTVITNSYGITFRLFSDDVLSELIYSGEFEWSEMEWINHFLKPGMVFFDVGANIGYYSLIAAKKVGSHGSVYSFEPTKKTFDRFCGNILLNKEFEKIIHAFNIAVSDKNGPSELFVSSKEYHAWNSLVLPDNINDFRKEIINTETLDTFFINEKCPIPDLIKIDVEGWEKFVLIGARRIIEQFKPVILIEFTKENFHRANYSYEQIVKELDNMNYSLFEYQPRKKKLEQVTNWDFEHKNIIAMQKK